MFTEKVCRHQLDYDPRPCNGTVTLKLHYYYSVGLAERIKSAVLGLSNESKTFVFLNVGFHDQLNESLVKERLLLTLLHTCTRAHTHTHTCACTHAHSHTHAGMHEHTAHANTHK